MGLLIGVGSTKPAFPYDYYYGIEWDSTVSNPSCTRVGKAELHKELPVQSLMRRCILKDDGTVAYYLNANDSTKRDNGASANLDGTDGQVMVELPDMYVRFETDGTVNRALMSSHALPGFHLWKKDYVSAYEATVQRSTTKLSSVDNVDADYRGGNNNASYDGTYRDYCGRPATEISLTNFRAYARKRGARWQCNTYQIQKKLYWLFAIEYATLNTQADFNAALDDNGYHQGGLGKGVTDVDWSKWTTLNGNNPFVPCGTTNSLGNHTGVVDYTQNADDAGTVFKTVSVPSYRGVENPFGHIWKWADGILCSIQSDADGGKSIVYVCDDPDKYSSTITDDYEIRGELPRKEGQVKTVCLGEYGEIMPSAIGAGSTTYFCDHFYTNIPLSGTETRGVLFCGAAPDGAAAGFVCADTDYAPTYAFANFGSRLCFEPAA